MEYKPTDFDFESGDETIISTNAFGWVVYDPGHLNKIDMFPKTTEGRERLIAFLSEKLLLDSSNE
jgi:hypothetical protein